MTIRQASSMRWLLAVARGLPPRPFLDAILVRVVLIWLVLRVVGAAGSRSLLSAVGAGGSFVDSLAPNPASFLWIAGAVLGALWIDMARRSESVFLANLGISFVRVGSFAVAVCGVLDLLLSLGISLG